MVEHQDGAHDSGSLPVWVRATAIVGIPGMIAFFLIWTTTNDLARRSDIEAQRAELAHYVQQAERNHRLLQQVCANTAKDNVDRAQCFQ